MVGSIDGVSVSPSVCNSCFCVCPCMRVCVCACVCVCARCPSELTEQFALTGQFVFVLVGGLRLEKRKCLSLPQQHTQAYKNAHTHTHTHA